MVVGDYFSWVSKQHFELVGSVFLEFSKIIDHIKIT